MRSILILAIAVVAFLWLPLSATIINVPADQATIQAGINASMSGDTFPIPLIFIPLSFPIFSQFSCKFLRISPW